MADKIAIFGGSFNPIHLGHIEVAEYAVKECNLKKVIFLPNAVPPHKKRESLISAGHRFNMVKLATQGNSFFEVSDYEIKRTEPSYTIDTMRYMKNRYSAELYFIIGADSLYTLHLWKSYKELIKECCFIVADRTSDYGSDLLMAAKNAEAMGGSVTILSMPKYDVTSTFIREGIYKGKDVSAYLPQRVNEYIKTNNLYKSNPEDKNDY